MLFNGFAFLMCQIYTFYGNIGVDKNVFLGVQNRQM